MQEHPPAIPPRATQSHPTAPAVILTALISTVVVSALWIVGIAVFYFGMSENTPDFAIKTTVPPQANVGDEILIQVEVTNPTDAVLALDSIDFSDSLLGGFEVTSIYPAPTDSFNSFGIHSYTYSKALSANETFKVSFLLKALEPGVWTGDIDFCNSFQHFVSSSATVRVDPPGTVSTAANGANTEVPEPPFVLDIVTPHIVTLGETFTLRAGVSNPTDASLVLDSIDFEEALSKGFEFQNIAPVPQDKIVDDGDPSLIWEKSLAPGESFTAAIEWKAVKVGIWTGDLSFWNENANDYVASSVTIRVKPAAAK